MTLITAIFQSVIAGGAANYLLIDPTEHGEKSYSQRKVQALVAKVCRKTGLTVIATPM